MEEIYRVGCHGTIMAHHGTAGWDLLRSLFFFILAPQKSPSFVCVKFSGLRYCDHQTYQDTCKRDFQPWILDTTLGTIASGTFIRLWSIRGGMLCEGDGILISQYIYIMQLQRVLNNKGN